MGICSSCESTHESTAKLILQDGRLMEFAYPVRATYVLQKNPMCFICNSDDMDFDDVLSAIDADEELQPGQIYFALPLSWLKRPLQADQMAALAARASSALKAGEKCRCGKRCVAPAELGEGKARRRVAAVGRRKRFEARLGAIPE